MFKRLIIAALVLMPTLVFGQDVPTSKVWPPPFVVTMWTEKFEDFATIADGKVLYNFNSQDNLSVEFGAESLRFDLDDGLIEGKVYDNRYVIDYKDTKIEMPFWDSNGDLKVSLNGWGTVRIVEIKDNGRVYITTWYKGVFNENKEDKENRWRWEVVHQSKGAQ